MPRTDRTAETSRLLAANQAYVARFNDGHLQNAPIRKLAVLTCMDARIDPLAALCAKLGDIHVIRNAGGRVTEDAIRSLVISQQLLGTCEVLVMHHTNCGMQSFHNQELRDMLVERLGSDARQTAAMIDFLPFADLKQSVHDDVEMLRRSPLIPREVAVYGAIYDVATGQIAAVE